MWFHYFVVYLSLLSEPLLQQVESLFQNDISKEDDFGFPLSISSILWEEISFSF